MKIYPDTQIQFHRSEAQYKIMVKTREKKARGSQRQHKQQQQKQQQQQQQQQQQN